MAAIYSPAEAGFDHRLTAVDRCQVALLRELSSQHGARLVLKGGMAMRAAVGSVRLTKDIDFDREASLSQASVKSTLAKSLVRAAALSGLKAGAAEITKDTRTTVRARLQGALADGQNVKFEVEVSGGDTAPAMYRRSEIVTPPAAYSMASFPVVPYRHEALAAMKVAAALSEQRNAPRDLYDLRDLIRAGADPVELLTKQDADLLQDYAARSLGKLEMLTYPLAQSELLPYLPVAEREQLTEEAWVEATLMVAERIHAWCTEALRRQEGA